MSTSGAMELIQDGLAGFGAGFLLYLIVAAGKKLLEALKSKGPGARG